MFLVLANHLWPSALGGGYVGVDVFFVISGYLITSHLWREVASTGRVRLGSFYARRIRRLLPAAFTVLAFSAVATFIWLPYSFWSSTAIELAASALYLENWALAAKAVDYSASTVSASLAQHYWSLSVEEQFYLLWPLLLVGLFWLSVKWRKSERATAAAGLGALVVIGLLASVVLTSQAPTQAYFVTTTRVWEFAVGGLIALLAGRLTVGLRLGRVLAVVGFGLIAASAILFDAATPFPGWLAAIPVAGTALVILRQQEDPRQWLERMLRWAPVQYLGGISYSLYLWHWPLIVLAPFVVGRHIATPDKIVIVIVAVLLSGATKVLVEDPGRRSVFLSRTNLRTFVAMVAGMAVVGALAGGLVLTAKVLDQRAAAMEASGSELECYGPEVMAPGSGCENLFGPAVVPVMSTGNQYWYIAPECAAEDALLAGSKPTHHVCDFSGGRVNPETVWLVGDSHAQQWQRTIFAAAQERGWVVKLAVLGGCLVADVEYIGYDGGTDPVDSAACMTWSDDVTAAIAADRPDYVFTSTFARKQAVGDGSATPPEKQLVTGLNSTWQHWTTAGAEVVVLADPPYNADVRSVDCALLNQRLPERCAVARELAQPADPLVLAASAGQPGVRLLDFTDYMCDQQLCYTVIGGVSVYFDANHLNGEFAALLTPMLLQGIR